MADPKAPEVKAEGKYRLKQDVGVHYVEGQAVEPGAVVVLSKAQAEAFADKFEPA
jgi:hypothetical protein